VKGVQARLEREYNDRVLLAWQIGIYAQPRKKYPPLKSLMIKDAKPHQTWQQQLAIAHAWAALGYGKVSNKVH